MFYFEVQTSGSHCCVPAPWLAGCTRVHSALALFRRRQGGVCCESGPERGRWRPQGPPNTLAVRPALPSTRPGQCPGPESGSGQAPARRKTTRRSAQPARSSSPARTRPADTRPVRSVWPGDTRAARSGFGRGVSPRGAAAKRAGGTAIAGEVGVFKSGKLQFSCVSGCVFHQMKTEFYTRF